MNRIGDSLFCTGNNEELVQAFVQRTVDFVVVGGLAVSWHCPSRQADDMDLLINPTPENSERISNALNNLNVSGYNKKSFTRLGLQAPLKQVHYAELLTPRKEGPNYSEVAASAVLGKLFNIPVLIASVASLVKLKELAVASFEVAKDKHLKDIELLKSSVV